MARLRMARRPVVDDVSPNVQPTFPFLLDLLPRFPIDAAACDDALRATRLIADMSARRWMRYQIFTFRSGAEDRRRPTAGASRGG